MQAFELTHPADMLYLKASRKAGALWGACEEKAIQGRNSSFENFRMTITANRQDFKRSQDATDCIASRNCMRRTGEQMSDSYPCKGTGSPTTNGSG